MRCVPNRVGQVEPLAFAAWKGLIMTDLVYIFTVCILLGLAIGWGAKMSVESEIMDVAGLFCAALALGYLAGRAFA